MFYECICSSPYLQLPPALLDAPDDRHPGCPKQALLRRRMHYGSLTLASQSTQKLFHEGTTSVVCNAYMEEATMHPPSTQEMGFGRTRIAVDIGVLGSKEVLHGRERRCIRIAMGSVSTSSCASYPSMAHSGLCHCTPRRPYAGPFLPTILQLDAHHLVLPLRLLRALRLFSPRHHCTLQMLFASFVSA